MLLHATPDPTSSADLLNVGTFAGLVVGGLLGAAYARWSRNRADYRTARSAVPRLRRTKWGHWWSMVRWGAAATALVVMALAVITAG